MKKHLRITLIILLILTLALSLTIFSRQFTGKTVDKLEYYSYTKAICNKTNYCQDYEIVCNGEKVSSIIPVTGAAVQNSANWKDPRDKETINKLC